MSKQISYWLPANRKCARVRAPEENDWSSFRPQQKYISIKSVFISFTAYSNICWSLVGTFLWRFISVCITQTNNTFWEQISSKKFKNKTPFFTGGEFGRSGRGIYCRTSQEFLLVRSIPVRFLILHTCCYCPQMMIRDRVTINYSTGGFCAGLTAGKPQLFWIVRFCRTRVTLRESDSSLSHSGAETGAA